MFEGLWSASLAVLASVLLVSGIDDFFPMLICIWSSVRGPRLPDSGNADQRRIAIFVPCWQEADVIGSMLRHNIAAIKYRNFDFFIGTYPNDPQTTGEVRSLAGLFGNVQLAMCHRAGPTSKADCLNSIFARMQELEAERGIRFDTIVLHDAEDIIHPDALDIINRERAYYDMVQVPVLPLKTGLDEITHGIYCDEFAEFQTLDMLARRYSGAFVPSNGVGTGFCREMLAQFAAEQNGQVFDPASLTEDYEIGVKVHAAGYRQMFVPLRRGENGWMVTREYFPRKLKSAIRQRTRWVTGIALQCWERVGWPGNWGTKYWFWRDRKGLVASPLSLLANVISVVGLIDYTAATVGHYVAWFASTWPLVARLCCLTLALQVFRILLRAACVARIYGLRFAIGVPFRAVHANMVNCCASMTALRDYLQARMHGRKLVWQKTDHMYPSAQTLPLKRRDLLEVLHECSCLSAEEVADLRRRLPPDADPATFLFKAGLVSEDLLCLSQSLQCGVPAVRVNHSLVRKHVLRSLPTYIEERYGLLPFDMHDGKLAVAGWLVPSAHVLDELKARINLDVEFQLVRRSDYEELRQRCYDLGAARPAPLAGSKSVIGENSEMRHFPPLRTRQTESSPERFSV